MELFKRTYSGESLCDLYRDVSEAIDESFNPLVKQIPTDEYNIQEGMFEVTITWKPQT